MSLDFAVYESNFPCPNYIKIDVDGLEGEIIDGAKKLICDERLKSILIEFNVDQSKNNILETLIDAGFTPDDKFNTMDNNSSVRRSKDSTNIARNMIYSRK